VAGRLRCLHRYVDCTWGRRRLAYRGGRSGRHDRLAAHRAPSLRWLTFASAAAALLALVSAVLGNVLYASYRLSDGPMERLIRKAPEAHRILFEFKEHVGLLPLPLAVAAAFVAWRYRTDLGRQRYLGELVALLLLLLAFYCLIPLVLGVTTTRLRGIL